MKQEPVKQERLKRERVTTIPRDGDDDGVVFMSTKRRRLPNITVTADGIEVLDLT